MNVNHGLPGLVVGGGHGRDVHVGLRASINGDDVGICGSILAIAARTGVVQALIRLDQDMIKELLLVILLVGVALPVYSLLDASGQLMVVIHSLSSGII